MNEMIGYIFKSLSNSENSLRHIRKVLRNQAKTNNLISAFMLATAAYVITMELRNAEQHRKIEKLSKKLDELEYAEGE